MTRQLSAQDVMVDTVVTLRPEMNLSEAWSVLYDNQISGAPVVDRHRNLLGVLSQTDLVREAFADGLNDVPDNSFYLGLPFYDGGNYGRATDKLKTITVDEVMSKEPICAGIKDNIAVIANKMRSNHIHRIVITDDKKVAGIISSLDLLKLLETQ